MAGLIAIGVLVIWLVIVGAITSKVAARIAARWRWLFGTVFFCALLVLPVADEIIGGFQFRALCKERMKLDVDAEKIRGRTVKHTYKQYYLPVIGIPVLQSDSFYTDKASGEVLATYTWLRARGGWLSRNLTEGRNPLTFGDDYECMPALQKRIEDQYQFTLTKD